MNDNDHQSLGDKEDFVLSDRSEAVLQGLVSADKSGNEESDVFSQLDEPSFDLDQFVNRLLPNPASLQDLPAYVEKIDAQCRDLDEQLRSEVRDAACSRARTRTALNDTQEVVADLFKKVNSISTKSESSQQLVADICRDIRILDIAKKNLTATITALKRLHMLSSAVAQLRGATMQRDFSRASNLLEAVQALEIHFLNVEGVAKLSEIKRKIGECKDALRAATFEAFGAAGAGAIENKQVLAEACTVVGVLGLECQTSLIDSVIRRQMEPYKAIFTPSDISGAGQVEDASFENADRRFAWFRRQIGNFKDRFKGVFPSSWNVPGLLAHEFCIITQQHLKILLKAASRDSEMDVAVLVRVLTQTIGFEKELQSQYGSSISEVQSHLQQDGQSQTEFQDELDNDVLPGAPRNAAPPPARIFFKLLVPSVYGCHKFNFRSVISSCFEPFMGCYVTLERKNMGELLQSLSVSELWILSAPVATSLPRYKGSDQLFLYIKNSMKRCCNLDQMPILDDVQQVYGSGLGDQPAPSAIPSASATNTAVTIELSHLQMQSLGVLINTAEYCSETLPQLQDSLSKAVGHEVDLSSVQEKFDALITTTIEDVVSIIMSQGEKALLAMGRLPLATMDTVGDTSSYVLQLKALFQEKVSSLSAVISAVYHHVFCSRLASTFLPKFMMSILRCRRINDFGAQQLLLDTEAFKMVLLNLPCLGSDKQVDLNAAKKRPPKTYTTVLLKQLGKTEAILKTISASPDSLAETYSTLLPLGNQADLVRIMDLKGLKKTEQQPILKMYNGICPVQSQMEPFFKDDGLKKFYIF